MTKECIICGAPVTVPVESEIVTCENSHCINTVENCVGLHQTIYYGQDAATDK